jgi:two-component system response regulator FixJ
MLVLSGYSVREYSSGAELLEAADELSGCILLDLHMPDADGFAVHEALKDRSIDVPIILVTGAGDAAAASAAGIAGLIQKPFRRADLLSLIEKVSGDSGASADAP